MITTTLLSLIALATSPSTAGAEAPFQDLTFDQALAAAKKDQKIVMIDFFTTWCVPCKKLDKITWKDANVQAWIGKTAVALKLDAEKEKDLAQRFEIEAYPTILFVKTDGTEIDRLLGFKEPADFVQEATRALARKDAVDRVKENMAGTSNGPIERMQRARKLVQEGKNDEALNEYLWCFDHGLEVDPAYAGVRLSYLLFELADLGRQYSPAKQALEQRRDAAHAAVFSDKPSGSSAGDLFQLNMLLETPERNIAAWEHLKKLDALTDNLKQGAFMFLIEPLVDAKRYTDAMEVAGNLKGTLAFEFAREDVAPMRRAADGGSTAEAAESTPATRKLARIAHISLYYEAAVGAGDSKSAEYVADKLIAYSPRFDTYDQLIDRALRAGANDAARALVERGMKALPESQQEQLKVAAKRVPEK